MSKKILVSLLTMILAVFIVYKVEASDKQTKETGDKTAKQTQTAAKEKEKAEKRANNFLKNVDLTRYELVLVNNEHTFSDAEFGDEKVVIDNAYQVHQMIATPYNEMKQAASEAGFSLVIVSTYRSVSYQETVYQDSINQKLVAGLSKEQAQVETDQYIAKPGTSEHHTGLALDVVDKQWQMQTGGLDEDFYQTEAGQWLDENCAKYGFIIRYPKGKEAITKINYEPWHLRYVGVENAEYIKEHELAFEEFLAQVEKVQNEEK